MDPTEKGKDPVKTFGPNIPYSLDIVFGKVASTGKLPVDVPGLTDEYEYNDEISYEIGYGLETNINNSLVDKTKGESKNIEKSDKKDLNNKDLVKKTEAQKNIQSDKERKIDTKKSNPGTGVTGLTGIIATLIAASSGYIISKKRN